MIARLAGRIAEIGADHAVVDMHGVGLVALLSSRTLAALGGIGTEVLLLTELHVREDALTLYGFGSAAERDWFRLLTGVQGVGGRVALAILSVLAPDELSRAIAAGDKAMVARANGVGAKLATRIVTELKDKAGPALGPAAAAVAGGGIEADAVSALANLGYRPAEASAAVAAAAAEAGAGAGLDALVRLALRKASRS